MKLSTAGLDLIKRFEGCVLTAYLDVVGVATIGYGHTGGVKLGDTITQEHADKMLENDVLVRVNAVNALLSKIVTQGQFDALVSFAYNVGVGNLQRSTLLKMINRGEAEDAGSQLLLWDKAGGRVYPGLTRRRKAELALYEGTAT
jgi:lysozyme